MTPNDRSAAERLREPGDLDEKGMADLRKLFPRAIASIEAAARREGAQSAVQEIRGIVRAKRAMYFSQTDSANTLNSILRHLDAIASEKGDET